MKIESGSGSVDVAQQKIDTVFADIEGFDTKDQITAIEYMEDKIKRFKQKNLEEDVPFVTIKTEYFEPKVEAIKEEVIDNPVCQVIASIGQVQALKRDPDPILNHGVPLPGVANPSVHKSKWKKGKHKDHTGKYLLSQEQRLQIIRECVEDLVSPSELARKWEVNADTIRSWVRKSGQKLPNPALYRNNGNCLVKF